MLHGTLETLKIKAFQRFFFVLQESMKNGLLYQQLYQLAIFPLQADQLLHFYAKT